MHQHDPNNFISFTTGYPFQVGSEEEAEKTRAELRAMFLEDPEGEETFACNLKTIAGSLRAGNPVTLGRRCDGVGGRPPEGEV